MTSKTLREDVMEKKIVDVLFIIPFHEFQIAPEINILELQTLYLKFLDSLLIQIANRYSVFLKFHGALRVQTDRTKKKTQATHNQGYTSHYSYTYLYGQFIDNSITQNIY